MAIAHTEPAILTLLAHHHTLRAIEQILRTTDGLNGKNTPGRRIHLELAVRSARKSSTGQGTA